MRYRSLAAMLAAVCLALPNAAQAKDKVLEPQSEWALDSDDESCVLLRLFGDGDGVVQLELRQFEPGAGVQVQIVSTERHVSQRDHMAYRFDPDSVWQEKDKSAFGYVGVPRKFEGVVFDATLAPPPPGSPPATEQSLPNDPDALAKLGVALNTITALSISDAFGGELTLNTGHLMQPFTAMRSCLDQVMTKAGLDPFVQSTISKRPKPLNLEDVAKAVQKAYPLAPLYDGKSAMLRARLLVDEGGVVIRCSAHATLADDQFSKAACKSLIAARFEPALDSGGKPVTSFWGVKVYYWVTMN